MAGAMGDPSVLRVRLHPFATERTPAGEARVRAFLGGVGLAVRLLLEETPGRVEPLSPEAPLVFALSPLVGTPFTTTARFAVAACSPLTGRLSDSLAGSAFALQARRAGLMALVATGRAPSLSVLVVDGGEERLLPAPELAGLPAARAEEVLRERLGREFSLCAIGPAGENLVRYATISHDGRHAGRGGLGAVMGAKNLKAVAVRGSEAVALADPERAMALARDLSRRSLGPATAKYRELGTAANLAALNRLAALPARNFQQLGFEAADALSAETAAGAARRPRRSCASCAIGCEHLYEAPGGGSARLEYESLFALGPLCGVEDRPAVVAAAELCDRLGLDTLSAGGTLAFAMECAQRGLADFGGLRFGDGAAVLRALEGIARREEPFALLAEGSLGAARALGGEAPRFTLTVKGLEMPGYEPRTLKSLAVGLAVAARGADHNRSGAYEADLSGEVDRFAGGEASALAAARSEERAALLDSLILCKFLRGALHDLHAEAAAMLEAVLGRPFTPGDLRVCARRILTAKKLYNLRQGWTAEEDTLPERLLTEPLVLPGGGTARLTAEELAGMVRAYYRARGWREDGTVPEALLEELGLADMAAAAAPAR